MPTLSKLKEEAARRCPYPIGAWMDAKFDLFSLSADSAFANCKGCNAVISVIVRPPEGVPHIALLEENGTTIPLDDVEAKSPERPPEQLELW